MLGSNVFSEPREELPAILGYGAEQARPVALDRQLNRRPRAPRKPRGAGLDLDGGFGLIDADYRGIQRFSLF